MDGTAHTGYRELLHVAADPSRWRILALLSARPSTVGELVERLGIAQPSVSHHLGRLRAAGLVDAVAEGRLRRYRWADPDHGTGRADVHRSLRRWVAGAPSTDPERRQVARRLRPIEPHLL